MFPLYKSDRYLIRVLRVQFIGLAVRRRWRTRNEGFLEIFQEFQNIQFAPTYATENRVAYSNAP